MLRKILVAFSFISFLGLNTANANIDLSEGTMGLSGNLQFDMSMWNAGGQSQNAMSLNVAPKIEYFVVDNFSLGLSLIFGMPFNATAKTWAGVDNMVASDVNFVLAPMIDARYYFDLDSMIFPYIGLAVGIKGIFATDPIWALPFGGSLGLLFALNHHVGLEVGANASYTLAFDSTKYPNMLDLQVGWVGVKAFF